MADRSVEKYLNDILDSITQIESYFDSFPRKFEVYCETPMMQRAIQMNISIIGEATNKLLKIAPSIPITKARKIVDTRNYMIHGYDSMSHDMVWSIVTHPILRHLIRLFLRRHQRLLQAFFYCQCCLFLWHCQLSFISKHSIVLIYNL